ncbi:MAG: enoyl-CoA hydratase/isomerase family protein [Deltaproteobacteria bacterium]|nr:enoyl-CoA hydratase/isomerase family protein [Deltaproteobacteria bacterium]
MGRYTSIKAWTDCGAAWIRIDRPPMNVLNIETIEEMNDAISAVKDQEKRIRALVIASEGEKAFSAGVDVADHTPDKVEKMLKVFHELFWRLEELEVPTVAAVRGAALGGGCELALCCDMVVVADNAKLGQPECKVGVFPTLATVILPRLIANKRAFELLISGDVIGAKEAHALGLVNQVVPLTAFEEGFQAFLRRITTLSGPVLRTLKRAIRKAEVLPVREALNQVEEVYLKELMQTRDAQEGLRAFMEKRAPVWGDE